MARAGDWLKTGREGLLAGRQLLTFIGVIAAIACIFSLVFTGVFLLTSDAWVSVVFAVAVAVVCLALPLPLRRLRGRDPNILPFQKPRTKRELLKEFLDRDD